MAILTGSALVLTLVWQIYRSGQRAFSRTPHPNPILARVFAVGAQGDSAAEAREGYRTRGRLDRHPSTTARQQALTDVTQPATRRRGGRR